ncbi:MAG: YbbR-like domain-containing protein [Trueperaceae bacterium]
MNRLVRWGHRLIDHWPRKVGAVAAALFVWLIVATDATTTAQRSLLVPLVVEGVDADRLAVGLPELVEVTVSGTSNRIDRLRPESFDAVLDLADVVGAFQVEVSIAPPQGIVLERVAPSEVIGELETVAISEVPVRVTVAGALGPDERLAATATPETAQVRGRASIVERVVAVVVPVAAEDARTALATTVAPYAVDAAGRPVLDVTVAPDQVAVTIAVEPVRVERRVPLAVVAPTAAGWSDLQDAPTDVLVTGPATTLDALAVVEAVVQFPTEIPAGGRYTRPLTLALPEGVFALEAPTVSVAYAPIPLAE